jgi:hypothetical protein
VEVLPFVLVACAIASPDTVTFGSPSAAILPHYNFSAPVVVYVFIEDPLGRIIAPGKYDFLPD